jgi:hypothetical protein
MKIRDCSEEYRIREFRVRRQNAQTVLTWRFRNATHFLLFMYDSQYAFDLEEAVGQLEKAKIADARIASVKSGDQIFEKGNERCKLFCLREREFLKEDKCFTIPFQEIKKGIPYEIRLFACNYDSASQELSVFRPSDPDENLQYIPVIIQPEIQYIKKWFSKQVICILKLPTLESYTDGAIMYHVENVKADFPLPEGCLGRELYIAVPGRDTLSVRIREEYRNYYKKA